GGARRARRRRRTGDRRPCGRLRRQIPGAGRARDPQRDPAWPIRLCPGRGGPRPRRRPGVWAAWAAAPRRRGRLRRGSPHPGPARVVGFGGYPSTPAVLAASLRRIPSAIHEQNGVMGRANRLLAPRVTAIATSFAGVVDADPALAAKATRTGNPLRPAVLAAIAPYAAPEPNGPLRLLAFGGSQGARIMADVVPPAVERLDKSLRARLSVVQQARSEDIERVRMTYARLGVAAEVAPFFLDLPARISATHLVVSRSGASTVAELAALGRP